MLPIDPLLPEIVSALGAKRRVILRAPPGAGKTTRVPAAILDAGTAATGEILVLEPRRLAARASAEYVARSRGEPLGETIGYRVRLDARGGRATRLWFVTEGIFGRRLARDPFLEGVSVVVLDEFHERHVAADVALGVVRELQDTLRPDLGLVVMSATLETETLARFLPGAAVLTSEGRAHPVAIEWAREPSDRRLADRVAAATARAVGGETRGDVLVFLPGAAEIRRATDAITPFAAERDLDVAPLHGSLSLDAQRRVLEPGPRRRVILSTNVAETSLTIEGVRAVVDSGLAREARFDARHGVNRLRTVRISRASADQRAGRAGRTAPGRCIRLWTEAEHRERRERESPEATRLDLAATVLEIRAWGLRDPSTFPWLDPPSESSIERADRLLLDVGALDPVDRSITTIGRRLLGLAVEPRLARMQIEAEERGIAAAGALLAALASEDDVRAEAHGLGRSPFPAGASGPSDLVERALLVAQAASRDFAPAACRDLGLDPAAVRRVERTRRALLGGTEPVAIEAPIEDLLRVALAGFPDRVARRRVPGSARAIMVGGAVVEQAPDSVVREAELFVAIDLAGHVEARGTRTRVLVASEIRREWLDRDFPAARRSERELVFHPERRRIVERRRELYRDLVLDESESPPGDRLAAGEMLTAALLADHERFLPRDDALEQLVARLAFLGRAAPELAIDTSATALLEAAIREVAAAKIAVDEIRPADLRAAVLRRLPTRARSALDRDAPERFPLPSGRSVPIRYPEGKSPVAAARLQDLFGLAATPRLGGGRVPLLLEILAPNKRPVQVTDDLASFWARTYAEVRRELRGRYPKHAWPEDPTRATPSTARSRRPR